MSDTPAELRRYRETVIQRPESIQPLEWTRFILRGDLSVLTVQQQVDYIMARCAQVGVNPLDQPFVMIPAPTTNNRNRLILVTTKALYSALVARHKATILDRGGMFQQFGPQHVYQHRVRILLPHLRLASDNIGVVAVYPNGDPSNAMMKAYTKATCRAMNMIVGLGLNSVEEFDQMDPASITLLNEQLQAQLTDFATRTG